jgi:hypothetical protein
VSSSKEEHIGKTEKELAEMASVVVVRAKA